MPYFDDDRVEDVAPVEFPNVVVSDRDIRAWAVAQGLSVGRRGRIPGDVRLAFEQAHAAVEV